MACRTTTRTPHERGQYPDLLTYANGYLHGLELAGAEVLTADAAWIQLTYTDGRDAQDFIGPTSVPEPSAGLLLGMGMMGLVSVPLAQVAVASRLIANSSPPAARRGWR